jgi:hypothetical protein
MRLAAIVSAIVLVAPAARANEPASTRTTGGAGAAPVGGEAREIKIRLKVGETTLLATLFDSAASRDFASLLPLTVTMKDLFRREKYAHLPRAISEEGRRARTCEVGQIAYWSPASDVAVFYRDDGQSIPEPGIIVLGIIDSGVEAFAFQGSKRVTIERVE